MKNELIETRDTETLFSIKEMANMLRVSEKTIYQWVACRKIPFLKIGKLVRFSPTKVMSFFEKRTYESSPQVACTSRLPLLASQQEDWSLKTRAGHVLRKE